MKFEGKKIILCNAFSLNMLSPRNVSVVEIVPITPELAKSILIKNDFESAIGHQSTANLLSQLFNIYIEANRKMVKLEKDTVLIVVQLSIRLAEGQILSEEELRNLLEQGKIKFFLVRLLQLNSSF